MALLLGAVLCAAGSVACSVDDGIDWRDEGRGMGRGLKQEGESRTAEACARAITAYVRDVGLPSSDEGRRAMQRGCEEDG